MKHSRAHLAHRLQILPVVLPLVVCLALVPVAALGAGATIGIYGDNSGSSCSLTGNTPGPLTAYVFVKPGSVGVRGVRFSAPIPSCFDASFIGEGTPPGIVSIGDSPTGISVSSGNCESAPFEVLEITYLNNGGTTPCCPYPVVADPFTGKLEAVDCAYQSTPVSGAVSYFNANASCACGTSPPIYDPPIAPSNPLPADQERYVSLNTQLRWQCSDPNGLGLVCDLYFGTVSNPPLIESNISSTGSTIYTPGLLASGVTYFWRVVARNSAQLETSGPVWYFTTTGNGAPVVENRSPANASITQPVTPTLKWAATDPDADSLSYDVYLGPGLFPPLVASGLTTKSWTPPAPLAFSTTYSWRVVTDDAHQHSVSSMQWSFSTKAESEPPAVPGNPFPVDGSTGVATNPLLTWTGSDPEGQSLTYDVYFGEKLTLSGASVGLYVDSYGSTCSFSGNNPGVVTAYVVVRPGSAAVWEVGFTVPKPACFNATYLGEQVPGSFSWSGNSQTGISVWAPVCTTTPFSALQVSFMSSGATPCCEFRLGPLPELGHVEMRNCNGLEMSFGGIVSHLNADESCACNGIFDLPKVASNLTDPKYSPGTLPLQTAYQWRVLARDAGGLERSSPYWSFTTKGNQPPTVPSNPLPANGAFNQSELTTLHWSSSDPEGQAITYDVYFGPVSSPPLVESNLTTTSYNPGLQSFSTLYRWRIVARDASGLTSTGPTWSYTTKAVNLPPNAPTLLLPGNGAGNQPLNTALSWNASDPENQSLTYDVYFGKAGAGTAGASIALYTDVTGSTCSFSGNTSGVLTAYVVVKPDATGIRGVRFSAPVPACFGGIFVGEVVPSPLVAIGSSQTGISIATPVCLSQPFQVLQIMYLTNGGTAPCCEYPVVADPFTGRLEAVDCSYADTPINTMLSHFNAGVACPCGQASLALVAQNIPTRSFQPGPMEISTAYYWRILVRDPFGLEALGPTWSFITSGDANLPPLAPSNPNPALGGSTGLNPVLTWQDSDPDDDPLTYVITVSSGYGPPIIGTTSVAQFTPGTLAPGVVYFWQVEAHDGHWSTAGPTWSFQANNGGGNVPVLFSRFDAKAQRGGVEIRWELSSDEPMDGYVLYRHEDRNGAPVDIAHGAVKGVTDNYIDTDVEPGKTYAYELLIHASGGNDYRSQVATATMAKLELTLSQNVPNPFNPQTTIGYDLPSSAYVRLMIFDVSGHLVRTLVDEQQTPGSRNVVWTGRDDAGNAVSSGVYFYVLDAGKQRLTRKLVLLK